MTFLPIVDRELHVAARITATYRNRTITAAAVTLLAMLMLMFGLFSSSPSQLGSSMFWTLVNLSLLFCLMEGIWKTADCLSEEKREGTLGLLFLTDLKGYDIILGKLAATSLNSVYGLLAILPVLAIPLLLGGILPGEFWRVVLALINALFFSLCAGIWVSARSRLGNKAMSATFAIITGFAVIPFLTRQSFIFPFSPAYGPYSARAAAYSASPQNFWHTLEITQCLSWSLLVWSAFTVRNSWQEREMKTPSARRSLRNTTNAAREARTRKLKINPAYWLATRHSSHRVTLIICMVLVVIGCLAMMMLPYFNSPSGAYFEPIAICMLCFWGLNMVIKMRIAFQACHCLAEARRNNALEMLLVTPLTAEEIIKGQLLAIKRTFLVPVITILSLEAIGLIAGLIIEATIAGRNWNDATVFTILAYIVGYLLIFAIDVLAVTWAGMWFGFSTKKENQAVTKTIVYVLLLPLLFTMILCYGWPFALGIPVYWIFGGQAKLKREFRLLAGQSHAIQQSKSGWWLVVAKK